MQQAHASDHTSGQPELHSLAPVTLHISWGSRDFSKCSLDPEPSQKRPTQAQQSDKMASSPGLGRPAVVHKHVQRPLVVDDQLVQTWQARLVV